MYVGSTFLFIIWYIIMLLAHMLILVANRDLLPLHGGLWKMLFLFKIYSVVHQMLLNFVCLQIF